MVIGLATITPYSKLAEKSLFFAVSLLRWHYCYLKPDGLDHEGRKPLKTAAQKTSQAFL